MTTIRELHDEFIKFRDDRDWKQFHTPKDLASAISIEASELQELFLWKTYDQIEADKEALRPEVEAELADIFAFVMAFADIYEIDLASVFREKMKANEIKYPKDKVKGSAKKYNKY